VVQLRRRVSVNHPQDADSAHNQGSRLEELECRDQSNQSVWGRIHVKCDANEPCSKAGLELYFRVGYPQYIRRDCSSSSVFRSDFGFRASRQTGSNPIFSQSPVWRSLARDEYIWSPRGLRRAPGDNAFIDSAKDGQRHLQRICEF
jgi:hypothetical protein